MTNEANTLAGFLGAFYSLHKRQPTDQEVFDAGVKSGQARAAISSAVPDGGKGEAVYQYRLASGDWRDQAEGSYRNNLTNCPDKVRIVYAVPQAECAPRAIPSVCDGKEQDEFEAWAKNAKFDMEQHPLHWLFLNERTAAARRGWKAALRYVQHVTRQAVNKGAGNE
jgi:hypothetical protein